MIDPLLTVATTLLRTYTRKMLFILKKPHYRLIFTSALVMLSGWIISASYLYLVTDKIAKNEAQITARHTARQAAITIQPYLVAEDIISLNFYLSSLTEARFVNGVAIYNQESKLIARSGESNGSEQQVILGNKQTPTGILKLYSHHLSEKNMLTDLLWQVAILSLITLLVTLITLWLALKPLRISANEPENLEKRADKSTEKKPLNTEEIKPLNKTKTMQNTVTASFTSSLEATLDEALKETLDKPSEEKQDQPLSAVQPETGDSITATSLALALDESNANTTINTQQQGTSSDETLNNDELMDLLRPDTTQRTPHFIPAVMPLDGDQQPRQKRHQEADYKLKEREELKESTNSTPPIKANPLRANKHAEEQLHLYSFEQQLELSLQPQQAAYLFYINATTGHADYVEPEEHQRLLQTYEKLIHKVSSIYGGIVSVDTSGNLQLIFDDQDEGDSHGVHALCAAKLFTLLYRVFNQARIKSLKPVLNFHMAIVRGNRTRLNLLKEEALFLTRTTQSNELISHTALTQASQLKATLLSSADVRREDEDKVLILSLSESYQALLTKQAIHLLSKPAKGAGSTTPPQQSHQ